MISMVKSIPQALIFEVQKHLHKKVIAKFKNTAQ
jgi:hypothetical protein